MSHLNPQDPPSLARAQELWVDSLARPLTPDESESLEAWKLSHPEEGQELAALDRLMDRAGIARLDPRDAFLGRLDRHVDRLIAADSARCAPASSWGRRLRNRLRWIVEIPPTLREGFSVRTLVVGRMLALYLGILAALVAWFLLRSPVVDPPPPGLPAVADKVQGPELHPPRAPEPPK